MKNLAIYDSKCYYCSLMTNFVKKFDKENKILYLPYETNLGKSILNKQFGDEIGFTLYLFEPQEKRVYWGDYATSRILEIINFPGIITWAFPKIYPTLVKTVSYVIKRHSKVCPPEEGVCKFVRTSEGEFAEITDEVWNEISKIV